MTIRFSIEEKTYRTLRYFPAEDNVVDFIIIYFFLNEICCKNAIECEIKFPSKKIMKNTWDISKKSK